MGSVRRRLFEADPRDFAPELARVESSPPSPMGRAVLYACMAFVSALLAWSALAHLDIVAVADGKLVPTGYLKVVQPAEAGRVREILVREGDRVHAGQLLARMDAVISDADRDALLAEYHARRLALRRVEAELDGAPSERLSDASGAPAPLALRREPEDPPAAFAQAQAQLAANARAHAVALAQERNVLERTRHDLRASEEVRAKLEDILPHYRDQEAAFARLVRDGYAGKLLYSERQRELLEKERDLRTQVALVASARSTIAQSERRLAQIVADYLRRLEAERSEAAPQVERLRQELAKLAHRREQLELRAPTAGLVKDLATHTPGTVVAPGTILLTLVPEGEPLRAEVWLANDDAGFVHAGQAAKLKLAAYPFQKYGMVESRVTQISADATESPNPNVRSGALAGRDRPAGPLAYRAVIDLARPHLESDGTRLALAPGMQLVAEIHLGERTVLEYLLSPLRKAFHEAGRER